MYISLHARTKTLVCNCKTLRLRVPTPFPLMLYILSGYMVLHAAWVGSCTTHRTDIPTAAAAAEVTATAAAATT